MAVENVSFNWTEFISMLPPQIMESIEGIALVLKAAGIVAILYVIYIITMGVLNYCRMRRIKYIEEKVDKIDKKLNILLRNKKKK